MSGLDMSVLCRDWTPTVTDRETVASLPLDKELTLAASLRADDGANGAPPLGVDHGDARTLILGAYVDEIELFGLRFWDGRLRLNGGTNVGKESDPVIGAVSFDFQVSFSPKKGGLAIVASWVMPSGERRTHSFAANISNLKLPPARYYTLRLGAPKHFADRTLVGWRVNATFDLAALACALPGICCAPVTSFPSDFLEFVRTEVESPEERELLADLFLGYNPATERVIHREPGRLVTEAIAPLDALRLALQSIDSWRKVAEDALAQMEGERG